jgi:hypothetical protein
VRRREADAEATSREAAAAGDTYALRELAGWLRRVPGRQAEAEATYREAAAAGNPGALHELAEWLRGVPGRQAETDRMNRHGLDACGRTAKSGSPEESFR